MRFWIDVHLPQLPLEAWRPRWCESGPHVLVDGGVVLVVSAQAAAGGVCQGMRRASVTALLPEAVLYERDPLREKAAFDSIALALLNFTPEVALGEEASLLLNVTTTLRIFGGHRALTQRVRACVAALGFTCRIGAAPTAQGAWLLARSPQPAPGARRLPRTACRRVITPASLSRRLDALPCALLPQARPHADWLEGIGCRTLGDLRKLPRAGLQRRANTALLNALDRAYGEAPELLAWIRPPESFSARLEMPERTEQTTMLRLAAQRLLLQLCGWLVVKQLAVSSVDLLLEHERGRLPTPPSRIGISLAEPTWHSEHLVRLLGEKLARQTLPAHVIAVRLETVRLEAMQPPAESLFPEPGGTQSDFRHLLELLAARLGPDCILTSAPKADHRPEVHNAWVPALAATRRPVQAGQPDAPRPCWLLKQPKSLCLQNNRPFHGSPLRLISGPERIECGWWDGTASVRDYFIAQDEDAACYWIYRERSGLSPRWYLHGLFG